MDLAGIYTTGRIISTLYGTGSQNKNLCVSYDKQYQER